VAHLFFVAKELGGVKKKDRIIAWTPKRQFAIEA
jgi:hypothetical protein